MSDSTPPCHAAAPEASSPWLIQAEELASRCVHCGFCNAVCPTYGLTGDEREGPRGRIWQVRLLARGQAAPEAVRPRLDHCLGCRACESICPSGVPYHRIAGLGRQAVAEAVARPWYARLTRAVLVSVLLNRRLFAGLVGIHRMLRPWLPRSLARLLPPVRSAPVAVTAPDPISHPAAEAPLKPPADPGDLPPDLPCIALLSGCVQPALLPSIDACFTALVNGAGGSVMGVSGAGCCGALPEHLDERTRARRLIQGQIVALEAAFAAGADQFTLTASGCAAFVHDWPDLLADVPDWQARAVAVVARFVDPVAILAALPSGRLRARDLYRNVALQAPCSLQHGGVGAAALESLLRGLGVRLVTGGGGPCCGSAGAYSLLYPDTAESLREARLDGLLASGADCIASANVGCIAHLQAGTELPVLHWLELLTVVAPAAGAGHYA